MSEQADAARVAAELVGGEWTPSRVEFVARGIAHDAMDEMQNWHDRIHARVDSEREPIDYLALIPHVVQRLRAVVRLQLSKERQPDPETMEIDPTHDFAVVAVRVNSVNMAVIPWASRLSLRKNGQKIDVKPRWRSVPVDVAAVWSAE